MSRVIIHKKSTLYFYRNLNGVNLNRNFPYAFNKTKIGSSDEKCSLEYHGTKLNSEKETQTIVS